MSNLSTIVLLPFVAAFLIFVLRFYAREAASSMSNPSFLLGALTVLLVGGYLILRITVGMPFYASVGFGLAGVALLATSIFRMFLI